MGLLSKCGQKLKTGMDVKVTSILFSSDSTEDLFTDPLLNREENVHMKKAPKAGHWCIHGSYRQIYTSTLKGKCFDAVRWDPGPFRVFPVSILE